VRQKSQSNLPFFGRPDFLSSLEKSFDLPVYTKDFAQAFEVHGSTCSLPHRKGIDSRIWDFVDVEVVSSYGESILDSSTSA